MINLFRKNENDTNHQRAAITLSLNINFVAKLLMMYYLPSLLSLLFSIDYQQDASLEVEISM